MRLPLQSGRAADRRFRTIERLPLDWSYDEPFPNGPEERTLHFRRSATRTALALIGVVALIGVTTFALILLGSSEGRIP